MHSSSSLLLCFLKLFFFSILRTQYNALVICDHRALTGLGDSGDFDFSLCKARVYAQHCGDIFMVKVLLKSRQVNVKLLRPGWAWNQKFHNTAGTTLSSKHGTSLSHAMSPAIGGPVGGMVINYFICWFFKTSFSNNVIILISLYFRCCYIS